MLQRIQSIYLFLAALAMGGTYSSLLDFGRVDPTKTDNKLISAMMSDGHIDILDDPIWAGLTGAAILIIIISIFLFNNRNLQINIARLGTLLILATSIAIVFILLPTIQQNIYQIGYDFGLQLVAIILMALAIRGIKKDNVLVKSMDRLR